MRRAGRTLIATLLCGSLAALTASPMANAQNRANTSGLPGGGNPLTSLEQQVARLQQQVNGLSALGQDLTALKAQMDSLTTLQSQIDALRTQANQQADSLSAMGKDITALKEQLTTLSTLQRQVNALTTQVQNMSSLQQQVDALNSQLAALTEYVASGGGAAEPLAVYDSNGRKVGDVVGVQDSIPWVSLPIGDQTVVLQVFPQQLVGGTLYFDGTSCTGNAYIRNDLTLNKGVSAFSLAAVLEPGGVIYAADPGASSFARTGLLVSLRDSAGFCFNTPSAPRVVPAKPVFTFDSMFQRPLHVR